MHQHDLQGSTHFGEETGRTVLPASGLSQGRQSNVEVVEFKLSSSSEPVVWKRMAVGKGLTRNDAVEMHDRLRKYRRELRNFGWNIPKLFHSHISQADDGWQIWSYEQYIPGGDAQHVVLSPNEPRYRKWFVLRTAIETLAEYPTGGLHPIEHSGRTLIGLNHGIDLKLANLVEHKGVVWLVDIFGIKELGDYERGTARIPEWRIYSRKLENLSAENLYLVCATREGMILRLLRLAERAWTSAGDISENDFRVGALDIIEEVAIPDGEQALIKRELDAGYPWLDGVYEEINV